MLFFLRLFKESFNFAINEILVNKVRTILSLLGITIGIFCIISVFTVFDSLEIKIKSSINSLGSNVLFIQKWPWAMGGNYPWWKYWKRPEPSLDDLYEIQRKSNASEASAFMVGTNENVKYLKNNIENATIVAVSQDYNKVMFFELGQGRYFSPVESYRGKNVAMIGSDIVKNLFNNIEPVGRKIKIFGRKLEVIGTLKKQGKDTFGSSTDKMIIIPVNYGKNFIDLRKSSNTIIVKAKKNITNRELKDELTGILRASHKLKPKAENNFAINETDIISKGFKSLFKVISIVGWIIGGFSLLVGGFGIANIMFVSVKERTHNIGIQKALGAKKYFILLQFLFESIFLSLFGGILGLILVFIVIIIVSNAVNFDLILTEGNIILGLVVSILIGLVSGLIPALSASKLEPVKAIRSSF